MTRRKQRQPGQLKEKPFTVRPSQYTHAQEMQRRKARRERDSANMPPLTQAIMQGQTKLLKTRYYVPAGRFKNVGGKHD